MHSMLQCGQSVPEDIYDGVRHFSDCLKKILVDGNQPSHWRQERDCFISCWTKLVSGSQDEVPHCDYTFEELSTGVAESISSGGYPEVITLKRENASSSVAKPQEVAVEEEPAAEEEVEEENQQDEAQEEYPAEDEVAEGEEQQDQVEANQTVGGEEAENADTTENAVEETKEGENGEEGGHIERRRGGRGGKGRRGRGVRGFRGGRGRGGFDRKTGEDAEGFKVTGAETNRGRGNWRGFRGGRGRGEQRGRGERGGRGRGERIPRSTGDPLTDIKNEREARGETAE